MDKCYACNKPFRSMKQVAVVMTSDDQPVWVGPDCAKYIKAAGVEGYQPPLGGPRLFPITECYCADFVAFRGPCAFCELEATEQAS